ncbi:fumarate hydratase C-terminal domain-containing protein [Pseudomonas canadensis]|uniref:fumarate hydratase C-terminal domain-containing protein n=1 Tax=Pseudomonas canadensis TaxID=915099 RepID=UPI002B23F828|nr:fumarate hydratase C-terminal domain-containing protein [Pseudomonas canadensis]MEB2647796.1 fumarate hydratase C-terminal domain-containing protein [Pseudomonas canadensis]
MLNTHYLNLPLSDADVRQLNVGDLVYLSGEIVLSAGLPTYQRIFSHVNEGIELPLDFQGGTLFHLGSLTQETPDGYEMLYLNPTTSTRFNPYMPTLIRKLGLRATGGKGGLDHTSTLAMQETGCVYLSFLGGGCSLLSQAIQKVTAVYWEDMISHYRLVKLQVNRLGPLTVGIDTHGQSLYDSLQDQAQSRLPDILNAMSAQRC